MFKDTFKILDFLRGAAVIKVSNPEDFKALKDTLHAMGLLTLLVRDKKENNLNYWREIAYVNPHLGSYYGQSLFFEYQPGKGITYSWNEDSVVKWFGKDNIYRAKAVKYDFENKELK